MRNRAGLGVTSREIADQGVVQGFGFDTGTREARSGVPKPQTTKTLTLLAGKKKKKPGAVYGLTLNSDLGFGLYYELI